MNRIFVAISTVVLTSFCTAAIADEEFHAQFVQVAKPKTVTMPALNREIRVFHATGGAAASKRNMAPEVNFEILTTGATVQSKDGLHFELADRTHEMPFALGSKPAAAAPAASVQDMLKAIREGEAGAAAPADAKTPVMDLAVPVKPILAASKKSPADGGATVKLNKGSWTVAYHHYK